MLNVLEEREDTVMVSTDRKKPWVMNNNIKPKLYLVVAEHGESVNITNTLTDQMWYR